MLTCLRYFCRQLPPIKQVIIKRSSIVEQNRNFSVYKPKTAKMSTSTTTTSDCEKKGTPPKSRLAIFDFDCTVIQFNSDDVVQNLLSNGPITSLERPFIKAKGWTKFMEKVFKMLHEQKVSREEICAKIRNIEEVPGMMNFMRTLHDKHDFDIIIISDANSLFINEWLVANEMSSYISQVFTNPAHFDETGLLCIQPYHHQTDCSISPANLCKGQIMEDYVAERCKQTNAKYKQLLYAGDGENDICPALRLPTEHDLVCARQGYSMSKCLSKFPEKYPLKAELVVWKNGHELLEKVERLICP